MLVYVGENVTVMVQGQTWRTETCKHCGRQFHYRVVFASQATTVNPYFIDSHGAARLAEESARNRLDRALRSQVFPVPCAHCELYQDYMAPAVQAEQYPQMRSASRFFLVLAPTFAMLSCMLSGAANEFGLLHVNPIVVSLSLTAMSLATAAWLWRSRRRRQAAYAPNAEEHVETRRRIAAAFALKPEEFARLRLPPTPAPGVRLGSPPSGQLVGQNCVRCGCRIPDELDSRFCRACGLPVHNRCAVPDEGAWCPTCGAANPIGSQSSMLNS